MKKTRQENALTSDLRRAEFRHYWRCLDYTHVEEIEACLEHLQPAQRRWLVAQTYPPYEMITE